VDELEGSAFGRLLAVAPGLSGGWDLAVFKSRRLGLEDLASQEAGKGEKAKDGGFAHARSVRASIRVYRALLQRRLGTSAMLSLIRPGGLNRDLADLPFVFPI
jgi:hypothetical protein